MKLIFISNLFPDRREPYRGLDNAIVLHHLANRCQIQVISPRPTLPFRALQRQCRQEDACFNPSYPPAYYVPRVGSRTNHLLFARALRSPLEQLLGDFPADVLLCSWAYPDTCAVARIAAAHKIPFVAITQGTDVHSYLDFPIRRRLIVDALNQAAGVITRSRDLARRLEAAGVVAEKLRPIYNGVDSAVFHPSDLAAARKALGLPLEAEIVLFVGNFYQVKDPLLTVEALAAFANLRPQQQRILVMLGGGPMERQIRQSAKDLGVERLVLLPGRQASAQVARYMQAANCLLLNSHNEGLPNVILEAIACGLPVVATKVGGISEVLGIYPRGRSVAERSGMALAQAIEEAMASSPASTDPRLKFDWSETADRYRELLALAVRKPNRQSA
jgi:teichuronic acid biosynthesis glycosyltransferase TuaC